MKKVLVWHQGALGDLILSLPAVRAIKEYDGGVGVHLICRGDMSGVIIENGLAEEVTSNEKGMFSCLFGDLDDRPRDLAAFLDGYNAAFVFMRSRPDIFLDNLARFIPDCHYIRTFPPQGLRVHVPRYQLEQLAGMGINYGGDPAVLDARRSPSRPEAVPVIAIHPGSGGKKKCWPLHNYLRLMEELHREGEFSFIVILGPAEESGEYETLREFISEKGTGADIMRNMPLSQIVAAFKKAALFVGNDSGVTHLASALGTPAVAIFGPTDHEVWKPLGGNVRIVCSGYPCSPCEEEDYRSCKRAACLESLPVETVLGEVRRLLRMV